MSKNAWIAIIVIIAILVVGYVVYAATDKDNGSDTASSTTVNLEANVSGAMMHDDAMEASSTTGDAMGGDAMMHDEATDTMMAH